MPTQHIETLLGATCCVRLATLLQHVATCWVLLAQILPFSNPSQQHPTCRNTSQHGGQTHATCCAQQCCDMLRWQVAIVWPGLNALSYVKRIGLCDFVSFSIVTAQECATGCYIFFSWRVEIEVVKQFSLRIDGLAKI